MPDRVEADGGGESTLSPPPSSLLTEAKVARLLSEGEGVVCRYLNLAAEQP